MKQAPTESDGGRSFVLAPSTAVAGPLPAFASNEETIAVRLRDTGDAMFSFGEDGSLLVDVREPRAAWSPLVIGATVEWTSSGSTPNPAGSIEIRIPDHLFLTYDGTPYETEYLNGVIPYLRTGFSVALGVPEAPAASPDGWQYWRDAATHEFVITNANEVGAGTKFVCDIDYIYDSSDGYSFGTVYDDALHPVLTELSGVPVGIYASADGAGRAETPEVTLATRNRLNAVEVEAAGVFDRWQPRWSDAGLEDDGAGEDAIYVVWETTARIDHLYRPFGIEIAPAQPEQGTLLGVCGIWVGETPESMSGTLDAASLAFSTPSEAALSMNHDDIYASFTKSLRYLKFEGIEAHTAVLVRYDESDLAKGAPALLSCASSSTLSSRDQAPQRMEASGVFEFQPIGFTSPPGNQFRLTRNASVPELAEGDLLFWQQGQIDRLESGAPTKDDPDVNAAYVSCYGSTREDGGDPSDPASYGKRPYSIELIDDLVSFGGRVLEGGEHEAKAILDLNAAVVTLYEGVADYTAGEYALEPVDGPIEPLEVTVSVKDERGEWTPALRWVQTENGRVEGDSIDSLLEGVRIRAFDPSSVLESWYESDALSSYDGRQRIDVSLPAGTTGVKMAFETTAWAASVGDTEGSDPGFGFTVSASINPTERTESAVAGASGVTRIGANTLVVRDADGELIGFEGAPDGISQGSDLASRIEDGDIAAYGAGMFHATSISSYARAKKSGSLQCYATDARNNPAEKTVELGRLSVEARFRTDTVEEEGGGLPPSAQPPERAAAFYILLPQGFSADVSTLRASERLSGGSSYLNANSLPIDGGIVRDRRSATDEDGRRVWQYSREARISSVDLVADWRDTGRDLLKVSVEAAGDSPGCSMPFDNVQYVSGFTLSLGGCYSWEALADYGNTLSFETAYESGNEDMAAWGARTNLEADADSIAGQEWEDGRWPLAELDGESSHQARWMYGSTRTTLSFPTSAEYGLTLSAKTAESPTWTRAGSAGDAVEAYAGSTYLYRLRSALEEGATATENVFYFPLESYEDEGVESAWRGSVEHVDVSALEALGVRPRVYYTTEEGIDFSEEAARDLSDASVWSPSSPASPSAVSAIAVDCSASEDGGPFRLEGGQALTVVVSMRAPVEGAEAIEESHGAALSQLWLESTVRSATGASSSRTLHNEHTAVRLKTLSFDFMKIDADKAGDGEGIAGAVFDLYRLADGGEGAESPDGAGEEAWVHAGTATSDPRVSFAGLPPGVYRLVESKAPEGYRLPRCQWTVTLDPLLPHGFSIEEPAGEGASFSFDERGLALSNEKSPTLPVTGAQGVVGLLAAGILAAIGGMALRRRLGG